MKQLLSVLFAFTFCMSLLSCGEHTEKAKDGLQQTKQIIKNSVEATTVAENAKKNIDYLLTKEPLTEEQFKSWAPENIDDFKRESLVTNIMREMNLGMCNANYRGTTDTTKRLYITITDGAGQSGSQAISIYRYTQSMSVNTETDRGYEKTIVKNGIKAVEKFSSRNGGKYEILFLHDSRFGVALESGGITDVNELWDIVDNLKLDELTAMAK